MKKPPESNEPTGYPEFGVRKEAICNFFSPPMPTSTFHDRVNKGIIIPIKAMRGFYKLNDSLRRLGLREVPELPGASVERTSEDMLRLAFYLIDPGLFPAPGWFLGDVVLRSAEIHHLELILEKHAAAVEQYDEDRLKIAYFQGVLDAESLMQAERTAV